MARIKTAQSEDRAPATWQQTIVERIRAGKLVPILGHATEDDLALGGHAALVQAYADYSRCPPDRRGLAEIAQYRGIVDESLTDALALKEDYVKFVKSRLYDLAEAGGVGQGTLDEVDAQFDGFKLAQMSDHLGFPRYDDGHGNPLELLANFDLPIYLTTGYHELLEAALRKAGKRPRTDFCRWHKAIESYPSVFDGRYEPSKQEPLVYHLHGIDRYEDSLVLTEDDTLRFLVACAQDLGKNTDPVHSRVRQALSDSSLLLLGYELQGWDFRSLFWGLIVQRTRSLASVVSIQLAPSEVEQKYLEKYLANYDFKVVWAGFQEYVVDLFKAVSNG